MKQGRKSENRVDLNRQKSPSLGMMRRGGGLGALDFPRVLVLTGKAHG